MSQNSNNLDNYFPNVEIIIDNNSTIDLTESLRQEFLAPPIEGTVQANNEDTWQNLQSSYEEIKEIISFNYEIPNLFKIIESRADNILKNAKEKIKKEITIPTKKLLGRKKKNSDECGVHNKFSDDNLTRKCKHIILDSVYNFINNKLKQIYNNKKNKKELLKLNQGQIISSKVNYNLEFLNKKLKDIFSDNISTKYLKYEPEHNKNLINFLLNEEDIQKRLYFQKLFNLRFFDCLKHFRGETNIKELDGMISLDKVCQNFKDEEYKHLYEKGFIYFIKYFEYIILRKRPRNRKKKSQYVKDI